MTHPLGQSPRNNHMMTAGPTNAHVWRASDKQRHKTVSCRTPHTHTHTPGSLWNLTGSPGKMSHLCHLQKQQHSDTMTEHSNTPEVPESPTHVIVSRRLTGHSLRELAGYSINTRPLDRLTKEVQPSRGYGTKIVYYKRNLTKMPNNLHCLK